MFDEQKLMALVSGVFVHTRIIVEFAVGQTNKMAKSARSDEAKEKASLFATNLRCGLALHSAGVPIIRASSECGVSLTSLRKYIYFVKLHLFITRYLFIYL